MTGTAEPFKTVTLIPYILYAIIQFSHCLSVPECCVAYTPVRIFRRDGHLERSRAYDMFHTNTSEKSPGYCQSILRSGQRCYGA